MPDQPQRSPCDVREEGFADRASVRDAIAWVDRYARITEPESVALEAAAGRILAQPFLSPADVPPTGTAVTDGYALRSCETVGADSYNPLLFCLQDYQPALRPFSATLVTCGTPLPMGADAVAPFDVAQAAPDTASLISSVAPGEGVNVRGQEAPKGALLVEPSRPLRPSDLAVISSFGIKRVSVTRRPLVRIIIAGNKLTASKSSPDLKPADANGPMLRALLARDGGAVEICRVGVTGRAALAECITRPGADVILLCGRTGTGLDDEAPLALADAGTLSLHGIAVSPGGSTGMGSIGPVPVILLPGSPLDCLFAYDLFAGRLIRNLSGRPSAMPYRLRKATLARKIVSSIGTVELCRVRLVAGEAIPMGSADSGGLTSVARADGFLLVPATMEGYASRAIVDVYTYEDAGDTVEGEGISR
jgi:molybdopterin molybdotransferase